VSHLLQRIAAELLADKKVARQLTLATETYARRREALAAALVDRGIDVESRSGLNVWIPVPDETSAVQALQSSGWAVMPGAPFRLQAPPAIRVTTGTLKEADAERLASAVDTALQPRPRTRLA